MINIYQVYVTVYVIFLHEKLNFLSFAFGGQ